MTEPPFVKLHYGPYIANGIIRHKTQRLHGVIERLTELGYGIEIVPSIHINRLTVEMLGREIFRCDIKNLQFNIACEDDALCRKLVDMIEDAKTRMYTEDNYPRYHPVSKGKRIIQEIKNSKIAQDLFSSGVKLWFEIPKKSSPRKSGEGLSDDLATSRTESTGFSGNPRLISD